jgi:hypothetical protein
MKREKYETNRDVAKRPKQGKYWCNGCDANLVNDWKKWVCRHRNGIKRNKK